MEGITIYHLNSAKGRIIACFILALMGTVFQCERNPVEPDDNDSPPIDPIPTVLTADAGPDQTTIVGSYAILDGSGSTASEGKEIAWYGWGEDENNPADVFTFSGDDASFQKIGFIKEGIYSFTLAVRDSLEGLDSEPDTVMVTVNPRVKTFFEDPGLEVQVRYALKKPLEELNTTELSTIDTLRRYVTVKADITSLSGLEYCPNLEYLLLGHQGITDLSPLASLTKLTYLNLTQNREIRDITPLAGLTELRELHLDRNEITDISPLANLTQLTYLNLLWNPFDDISALANMHELEELWLSHSPFGDISALKNMNKLWLLWLSHCQITDVTPLADLNELRVLHLNYNNLTDITPLAGLVKLERLRMSDNQVVDISPVTNMTQLNVLILGKNQIVDILPLVVNQGINAGDFVSLGSNPLNDISINEYIPVLRDRGVYVAWP